MKSILDSKLFPVALIIAALGAFLLLMPSLFTQKTEEPDLVAQAAEADKVFVKQMESQLAAIVKSITGKAPVSVTVTLESGTQYVYHSDSSASSSPSQSSSQNKLVTVSSSSGEQQPILIRQILPQIMGAVIVCDGINASSFEYKITEAVKTALGIPSSRIFVTFS